MKLVNVEDLKVLVAVESKGEIRYGKLVTDLFDDIQIVEAIPKEFIEKKIDEYLEVGLNSIAKELNVILAEWEKENETN